MDGIGTAIGDVDSSGCVHVAIFAKNNRWMSGFLACRNPLNHKELLVLRIKGNKTGGRRGEYVGAAVRIRLYGAQAGSDVGKQAAIRGQLLFVLSKGDAAEARYQAQRGGKSPKNTRSSLHGLRLTP